MGKINTLLKRLYQKISGQVKHLSSDIDIIHNWYGNNYGGFYVHPNIINNHSIVYSIGIGEDISFDKAIINAHGCKVFGYDPTPKSIALIEVQSLPYEFIFSPFGLHTKSEEVTFYLPLNEDHVSGSAVVQSNINQKSAVWVKMLTLSDMAKRNGHERIDLLKMDIEGSEYEVLDSILSSEVFIGQVCIEFHDRFYKGQGLKSKEAIDKLKKAGYLIFGVSNSFEEISLIHSSLIQE